MKSACAGLIGLLGIFFFAGLAGAQTQTPQPPVPHYYGIEHAVIEFVLSGAVKGKEIFYFDQFGMRQAHFKLEETQRWGTTNTITLNIGPDIMIIDPNKNLGQKKEDAAVKQVLSTRKAEDTALISLEALTVMGGKKVKDENFLDRPCEVWEAPKLKAWVWNGIVLKSEEQTPDGVLIRTATSVDQSVTVDEKYFAVPEGLHFIDRDINQILISQGNSYDNTL